ncbi:conserved membrane hypothetical protein [Rubrivivax sp. A210]|uniref:hypothetical protein n=1 Tax=Rubrivivax sp. A210 TaxID=2772301 RepID=UPI0019CDE159|nr:hypothetical protein [Rubrivivax sp. A210]CAD5371299.1 conserved membrane hypothetical protein [Rubrivivax sp. A210]
MGEFMNKVEVLRHDDHRYYHQCRINQTLHLVSAISFVVAYGLLFVDPAAAAIVGWLVGMVTRQSGHIFFEPRGYDRINQATDSHKEAIKVGFNMQRKSVLIGIWLMLPLLLGLSPSLFGLIQPEDGLQGYVHDVGLGWLALGAGGLLFRTVHLFFLRSPAWGLAWATKIITDPFHNIAIYWKSPLALLSGQRYDPMQAEEIEARA